MSTIHSIKTHKSLVFEHVARAVDVSRIGT